MTSPIEWVTVDEVVALNQRVVAATCEGFLITDQGGLESAVARPIRHFEYSEDGDEDDLVLLASKLCIGISEAQAFQQGNKRTGLAALEMMLNLNGFGLSPHAHVPGRLADLVLASAHPDHSVRLHEQDFADAIDEFVIESDDEFMRGDTIGEQRFEDLCGAMGGLSEYKTQGYEAVNVITVGFHEPRPTRFEGVTAVDMPTLLAPEQMRNLGRLDIDKVAFKRQDPEDE